ncbi:MAG: hypothetical protein WDN00_01660 [Limisphaerales bacterium]
MTIRLILFLLLPFCAFAEDWKFPVPENEIAHYTARHVSGPMLIDGKLNEKAWQQAPRSPRFVDIITGQTHDSRHTRHGGVG